MKLYWRIKKNGKWTWRPAVHQPLTTKWASRLQQRNYIAVEPYEEEDEEE
jgi:hypothetical protein